MKSTILAVVVAVLLGMVPLSGLSGLADERDVGAVDFAHDVLPLLSEKCFVCHGPDGTDKDVLRLDSFAAATVDLGGYKAIDPEALEKSAIIERVESSDDPMPPEDAEKQLTPAERELLVRWVRQGGEYATHWSFVPPQKNSPADADTLTKSDRVDAFIRAGLKKQGFDFAPEADRATLARRVALVLTGLPPEPEQLKAFLADNRADAYERFVDTMLASPRYGEHQARYWLDAVRYGDTHGLHLDNRRGIYPYRNWVIYALNKNLPLDEFITWQLAGDLLPDPTLEQLVATGFVRMNPTTSEGGVIPAEFQAKNNFDRVETLGTVLLGTSLICARCHNHKYDPVPQHEYYRLLAFFNSTAENPLDGNKYEYGPVIRAPATVPAWDEWNALETRRKDFLSGVDPAGVKNWGQIGDKERLARVADPKGPFKGQDVHKLAVELTRQMAELEKTFTTTLIARELPKPRTTLLLERGEYDMPTGDPLEPGILTVMGEFPEGAPRNRLGLAQWLTSREHPLVSRVLVNRIWQRTFGDALVRTPEDFGLQGEQPTHPELLDWLAVELQDSNWDLKHMLRLLVTTRTFRQRSAWRSDVEDPTNRLFARGPRHRLDAEVLRDVGLWTSGLLDPTMGGEGVKPYQPAGLWAALMHPASNTKKYVQDQGEKLYRRSLYVYWKRTCPHPVLTVFDAPSREVSCVRRSRTTTPLQSLALLNETQRTEMSRKLAERLLHEGKDDGERLSLLFTLLASREPTEGERAACVKLLETMRGRYSASKEDALALLSIGAAPRDERFDLTDHAAWTQVAAAVLASDVAIMLY
jgi:hypothetical protein